MPLVFPQAFRCRQCGACCRWPGTVTLADGEPDAIAAFLGIPLPDFLDRYARLAPNRSALVLADAPGTTRCIFLDAANRCAIHPVRPRQCRTYPFLWNSPPCPNNPSG
ncbi:MAG: YkgJ family cysteine cluster protein [Kiritimatiellae bacterium]|nr:YkgJ family cysteine cluster protein [Kiritimatiellia bacterium]